TNAGESWKSSKCGLSNLYGISFIDKNNGIIVGGQGNILLTTDRGKVWQPQKSGTFNDLAAVANNGSNWVVTGGFGTILKSDYSLVSVKSNSKIPTSFGLKQNYPNPFNPSTTISYSVPYTSYVVLKVYDILGKEVATLVNEEKSAGIYRINFTANNLSSGVYFYRIQAGNYSAVKKFVLLR
ncbi:MAG: T9SS type A sorting domain-containing protein, partial [Ignavibacteriaceae bacterium]